MMRDRGISGASAPASLKPGYLDAQELCRFGYFRGIRPGLIEALGCGKLSRLLACISGASAPASLKLFFTVFKLVYFCCISGASAPASLKPFIRDALNGTGGCISGASAPASLKHQIGQHYQRRQRSISGASAPASLKLGRLGREPDVRYLRISGASAPASLKQAHHLGLCVSEPYFRGIRPGLIEAKASRCRG